MVVPAGRAATVVPADAEAEAARVVPAGRVATAVNLVNLANPVNPERVVPAGQLATAVNPVNLANLADNRGQGTAQMTPEPYPNVQIPRVGRDVDSPRGTASDAYQAASEPYQSVMVVLAKLIGFLVMMAAGMTLIVTIGYVLGGDVGAFIMVAIVATILIVVFRSDKAVARRGQLARGP